MIDPLRPEDGHVRRMSHNAIEHSAANRLVKIPGEVNDVRKRIEHRVELGEVDRAFSDVDGVRGRGEITSSDKCRDAGPRAKIKERFARAVRHQAEEAARVRHSGGVNGVCRELRATPSGSQERSETT